MLLKKKWLSAQKSGAEGIFCEKAVAIIYTERGSTFQIYLKGTERDIHSAAVSLRLPAAGGYVRGLS